MCLVSSQLVLFFLFFLSRCSGNSSFVQENTCVNRDKQKFSFILIEWEGKNVEKKKIRGSMSYRRERVFSRLSEVAARP